MIQTDEDMRAEIERLQEHVRNRDYALDRLGELKDAEIERLTAAIAGAEVTPRPGGKMSDIAKREENKLYVFLLAYAGGGFFFGTLFGMWLLK